MILPHKRHFYVFGGWTFLRKSLWNFFEAKCSNIIELYIDYVMKCHQGFCRSHPFQTRFFSIPLLYSHYCFFSWQIGDWLLIITISSKIVFYFLAVGSVISFKINNQNIFHVSLIKGCVFLINIMFSMFDVLGGWDALVWLTGICQNDVLHGNVNMHGLP